jgi:hypothetical protein
MKTKKNLVIVFLLAALTLAACGESVPPPDAPPAVQAEAALKRGVAAQEKGNIVEALAYYYSAAASDPSMNDASTRLTGLSGEIAGGGIGREASTDIDRLKEWLKALNECAAFFKEHLPYEIDYDQSLTEGKMDYQNETVDLRFYTALWPAASFQVLDTLLAGLEKTGKRTDWGLGSWPLEGEGKVFDNAVKDRGGNIQLEYPIEAALLNGKGKTIATAQASLTTAVKREGLSISRYGYLQAVTFTAVKAQDITGSMTVKITKINGRDAADAVKSGYVKIALTGYTPPEKDYKTGDTGPAGGIVFYIHEHGLLGWRYLEAAPRDLPKAEWGARGTSIGGTESRVGSGKSNTGRITGVLQKSGETGRAAQLCAGYELNGYRDWFLPSKDELDLMYKNLKTKGLGGFTNDRYCSSSEDDKYNAAWLQYFDGGRQDGYRKDYTFSVRAVRAF